MIMTVEELRQYINTDETEQALEAQLQALELSIQGHTQNNFKRVCEKHGGEYPLDIKLGVAELLKWKERYGSKTGLKSETISRHSVTFVEPTRENTLIGYPAHLLGFLEQYMCAQFGQGVEA